MSMQVREPGPSFHHAGGRAVQLPLRAGGECRGGPRGAVRGGGRAGAYLDLEAPAVRNSRGGRSASSRRDVGRRSSSRGSQPRSAGGGGGGARGAEERFAFRRAVSRLLEMQSPQYILEALRMRQQQNRIQKQFQNGIQI
ncbi:hypothetical protein Vretifemale_9250 [Volvox reticuliferus]|uniref:Uncharacterized protein n=1 Tax=Volvox reticuliferus TaxID=1737510 RepID=A0A8J4CCF1_9CHLO|nr:hypothetical protein Vretifemale_9250 [Volvox reticuliferus]